MGMQQSCMDRQVTKDLSEDNQNDFHLKAASAQRLSKCGPYELTPEADQTYKRFVQQFSNNEYLDIQYGQQAYHDVKQFEGFFKLSIYDACYHGEWKNYKPHGKGIAIFPNGSILVGIFAEGYCDSDKNYFIFADGSYFVGNIHANRISGKGKLTNNNLVYEGFWSENVPHGQGIETYSNGDRYIGNFQKGMKHSHDALFIWNNHDHYQQYKGEFKQGKICGHGTLIMKNKTTVQGIFNEADIMNCVFSSNRYKFTGSYKEGKFNGKGHLQILENNESYDGNFKEGKLYGQGNVKDMKHRDFEAFFFNNRQFKKMHGLEDNQLQRIIKIVESSYRTAQKHSQALAEIAQDLEDEYQCKFIEPFEHVFKYTNYIVINIFDRVLLVRLKRNRP